MKKKKNSFQWELLIKRATHTGHWLEYNNHMRDNMRDNSFANEIGNGERKMRCEKKPDLNCRHHLWVYVWVTSDASRSLRSRWLEGEALLGAKKLCCNHQRKYAQQLQQTLPWPDNSDYKRGLYTAPCVLLDSTGFHLTCHLNFVSVTRAKLACLVWRSLFETSL